MNLTPANILSAGFLFNDYHSPYDGISSLVPQDSTTKTDITAWLPYIRDQHTFANGALLELGVGVVHFRDGYEPHGDSPYALTPELTQGSYFQNLVSHSQREEGKATLYLPPRHWEGRHDLKAGLSVDHIGFDESVVAGAGELSARGSERCCVAASSPDRPSLRATMWRPALTFRIAGRRIPAC